MKFNYNTSMKKALLILLLSTAHVVSSDTLKAEPIIDMTLRYENMSKLFDYTILGQNYSEEITYNRYLFGGILGTEISYEDYYLGIAAHGIGRFNHPNEQVYAHESVIYKDYVGYLYLGELYLGMHHENMNFKIGRQTYNSSLVSFNKRITPNSYEGLSFTYNEDRIDIQTFYFNRISSSPFAYAVPQNHPYGALGYGRGYEVGSYVDLSEHILGSGISKSTAGAFHAEVTYGDDTKQLHAENLFVDNFFNTLSLSGTYTQVIEKLKLESNLGAVIQNDVGKNHFDHKINARLIHGKFTLSHENTKLTYAASKAFKDTQAQYNGTLISPFSNTPIWVYGINSAHATIADTTSWQVKLSHLFYIKAMPLFAMVSHVRYDISDENGLDLVEGFVPSPALDTRESFVYMQAYFSKQSSLSLIYSQVDNGTPLEKQLKNFRMSLHYSY